MVVHTINPSTLDLWVWGRPWLYIETLPQKKRKLGFEVVELFFNRDFFYRLFTTFTSIFLILLVIGDISVKD